MRDDRNTSNSRCMISSHLLSCADRVCKPADSAGPITADYLAFGVVVEAAIIFDELVVFDPMPTIGTPILEGPLGSALNSTLPVKLCNWEGDEDFFRSALSLEGEHPGPYSAVFEQRDGTFMVAGNAICPRWAIEKYGGEEVDPEGFHVGLALANAGIAELGVLKASEVRRFKRLFLAKARWEIEGLTSMKEYFESPAMAVPLEWAPVWDTIRQQAARELSDMDAGQLMTVDCSRVIFAVLDSARSPATIPKSLVLRRQEHAPVRVAFKKLLAHMNEARTNADLSDAIERWHADWSEVLSHSQASASSERLWYRVGGIAVQPRAVVGDTWDNLAPATGLLITHAALVSH